jgi:hypothetical protein
MINLERERLQRSSLKNPIRLSFLPFIFDILELLNNQIEYSLEQLESELNKSQANAISGFHATVIGTPVTMNVAGDTGVLTQALNEQKNEVLECAKDVNHNGIINKGQLLYTLFGGTPLTTEVQIDKPYDMVVEQTPNRSIAIVYCPTDHEVFDELEIQVAAENEYKIPCTDVKILYPVPTQAPVGIKSTPAHTLSTDNDVETPDIGRILYSKKFPMILSENSEKDRITALVYESHSTNVLPNEYVKLINEDGTKTVICRVVKVSSQPISAVGITKKVSEIATILELQPLVEKSDKYKGKPKPGNLSGLLLQKLSRNELIEILHIPRTGLALGHVDYDKVDEPFLFPLEPDTSIFQSMIVAGVQGKGKTSFIKLLIMSLTSIGVKNGTN